MAIISEHMSLFIESTKETFSRMVGLQVKIEKRGDMASEPPNIAAISGIIGFTGDIQGVMIIEFPLDTALAVVSRFIGEEVTEINPDVTDAIGELANIISGNAKKYFESLKVSIGLPTVVKGSDYVLHLSKDVPTQQALLSTDVGQFVIELCTKFKED